MNQPQCRNAKSIGMKFSNQKFVRKTIKMPYTDLSIIHQMIFLYQLRIWTLFTHCVPEEAHAEPSQVFI